MEGTESQCLETHHLSLAGDPSPTGYPSLHVPTSLFVGQIAWALTWPGGNGPGHWWWPLVMARQWLSIGLAVALVLHVLVATRGWRCLAEGPAANGLATPSPHPQPQPPAPCQVHSLRWAQHLSPSQGSAGNLMCNTGPARTASLLRVSWLMCHQDCALSQCGSNASAWCGERQ